MIFFVVYCMTKSRVLGYKVSEKDLLPRRPRGPAYPPGHLDRRTFRLGRHRVTRQKDVFEKSMIDAYIRDGSICTPLEFQRNIVTTAFPTTSGIVKTSEGSFGVVYKIRVTRDLLSDLRRSARTGWNVLRLKMPRLGATVACKIEYGVGTDGRGDTSKTSVKTVLESMRTLESRGTRETRKYIRRVTNESMVHATLATFKGPRGLNGRSFPGFYMSWMDPTYGVHITISEFIRGITVDTYKSVTHTSSKTLLRSFERAIRTMWYAGFAHFDTHLSNVMITKNRTRIVLLDFGRAQKIPTSIHTKIVRGIDRGDHLETVWRESGLRTWMHRAARRYGFYHPNIRGIRRFVEGTIFS